MRRTPVTPKGLAMYDLLTPTSAVVKAWNEPGANSAYHKQCQNEVRKSMPLLARALDRLSSTN